MIRVNTREYCEGCIRFSPATMTAITMSDTDTVIKCVNAEICEHVANYYRKRAENEHRL